MNRGEQFIKIYNELDHHLRHMLDCDQSLPFYKLVELAAQRIPAVKHYSQSMRDFGNLRNAIVHNKVFPGQVIAEPLPEALKEFQQIHDAVTHPPRLIPKFQRETRVFSLEDPLPDAVTHMGQHDYSQVVVSRDEGLGLLSVEGISRWLEKQLRDDLISLKETAIHDVLECEPDGSFQIMSRNATVFDALAIFSESIQNQRPRIYAIVVTHSGQPTEKPLGIVTPWDLLPEK